jgi:hypothetical protein
MNDPAWIQLGILIVAIAAIWLDLRSRQGVMHKENIERLTRVETKIEPMWDWWNDNGRPGHK